MEKLKNQKKFPKKFFFRVADPHYIEITVAAKDRYDAIDFMFERAMQVDLPESCPDDSEFTWDCYTVDEVDADCPVTPNFERDDDDEEE